MKNKDLQVALDKSKWYTSEKTNEDMSGKQPYCAFCQMRQLDWEPVEVNGIKSFKVTNMHCVKPQSLREEYSLCAIAYNKMAHFNAKHSK